MEVTHKSFKVEDWAADKLILNPHINHEIEFFKINTSHGLGVQPITGKSMINPQKGLAGIIWRYFIRSKTTGNLLLNYIATDEYHIDASTMKDADEKLKNLMEESHQRLSAEFDKRKAELGIRDEISVLDENEKSRLRHALLSGLIQKFS